LPSEHLLYVADSKHCPYGGRSDDFIRERSRRITRFLLQQGAKGVVVACNTATSAAIDELRREFSGTPFVGMEPAVKPAAAATRGKVVGVLATGATLGGDRFAGLAQRFADGIELLTQPCPGLVEQVEAGDLDSELTRELLRQYAQPLLDRGADTLVLGCTHYPFLRGTLADLVGPDITLIDTGEAVARQLARVLAATQLQRPTGTPGLVRFCATDGRSEQVLRRLWQERVEVSALDV
jgi:glutamate racemase